MAVDVDNARVELDRELTKRRGLHHFIKLAWSKVEPAKFIDNWHIGAIAEHLQALYAGEIQRLLINVPPGTGKSLITSVFFPVWVWTLAADEASHAPGPATRFHYLSYDQKLSLRDAIRARELVTDPWFQARWGGTDGVRIPHQNTRAAAYYKNSRGGMRLTVTLDGGSIGHHGHIQAVDDPIKAKDTQGGADKTRTVLRKVEDIWAGTLATRIADPKFFRRMITMQRLHDADLSGHALSTGTYTHLMIPLRYEPKRAYSTGVGQYARDPRGETGVELMWPERTNEDDAKRLETELGAFASAQLQQDPVPTTGGIFQREWLAKFWSTGGTVPGTIPLPDLKKMQLCQSWDMTFKKSADADRVAGGVWARHGSQYFLLDEVCRRMSYTETKQAMRDMRDKWPRARACLVEDKANGSAILDEMSKELSGLIAVDPEGGKEARAWAVSPLFQAGNVILPHPSMAGYGWMNAYIEELARFPKAPHDDEVDETTQALNHLSLHAPKWVGAMGSAIARDKARQAPAQAEEPPAPVDPEPAPVDVTALRARLGRQQPDSR